MAGKRTDSHRGLHSHFPGVSAGHSEEEGRQYVLLNDQPVDGKEGDLLGTGDIAEGIAAVLFDSRASSPFVLTVDAGWGMGKSTLLRQIESRLPQGGEIAKLRFNAWTAESENALEGLIKTVLGKLDPNIVRRWIRLVARKRRMMLITRLGLGIAARFFGVARLVDELWDRVESDARSRNEMRDLIHGMLSDWIGQDATGEPGRALVVFIDDLDRCSDDVVVKVCEAVKLYLDAPGIIFVLACDQSVLARGVSASARGGTNEGRVYLEKIVQVVYRVPSPEDTQIKQLIFGYAQQSGTADLIDESVAGILAAGTGHNPRKIKRIINSFVLEYRLDPDWHSPPLGSVQLVRAVLLQHLYPLFYELLISEDSGDDPIGVFLDYAKLCERAADPPEDNPDDPWWDTTRRTFQAYRLVLRWPAERMEAEIQRLERYIPEGFPELARNNAFVMLLHGIGDNESRRSFRAQLRHRPLATETTEGADVISSLVDALSGDLSKRMTRPPARGEDIYPAQKREPPDDFNPLPSARVTNLVMLRMNVTTLLTELAFPPPPGGFGRVSSTIETLRNRGVLGTELARALSDTLDIADRAAGGSAVPPKVALAVENSGPAILEQLALLRTVAAARFEDHVLDRLQQNLPAGWLVEIDAAISPDGSEQDPPPRASVTSKHARADALVRKDDRSAVVEVRARLQPGSQRQVMALRDWLQKMPSDLPVLLVAPGEGLNAGELNKVRNRREGAIELLSWDWDADSLITTLRGLLEHSGDLCDAS
jgi:hypothetical protein